MHELYPEAEIVQPMKIWKLPKGKEQKLKEVCDSGDYFAQIKKDGYFFEYEKTQNYAYLFSRTTSRVTGTLAEKSACVPHIMEALSVVPEETIIIGEIYYPNFTSKKVTTIMGCLPEKAIKRQEKEGPIHFYMHDIIKYKGKDLKDTPAIERYGILNHLYFEYNLNNYDFLELAYVTVENIYQFSISMLQKGEEGTVLKKKTGKYYPDKRPAWETIKVKKNDTIDAFIIGFCDPTVVYNGKELENWTLWEVKDDNGEWQKQTGAKYEFYLKDKTSYRPVTRPYYYGWKTAIEIGCLDGNNNIISIGTISSGLTDVLREAFAVTPELYLNKVVEIECMEKNIQDKTLRHGFLLRIRDDKKMEDCSIDTIF